jgi:hypothetical protein
MRRLLLAIAACTAAVPIVLAVPLPLGDTQGVIKAVVTDHNVQRPYNSFLVFMTSMDNDRFGCIATNGYITVKDTGIGVSPESYRQMFGIALTAQASGRRLALSSSGADPCSNVNQVWMLD